MMNNIPVRLPLMPLGVEHDKVAPIVSDLERVRLPLMPLGVEHEESLDAIANSSRAITSDANRRVQL